MRVIMKLVVGDQGKGHDGVGSSTMVRPHEKGLVFFKKMEVLSLDSPSK
jgi:hypothetical protein